MQRSCVTDDSILLWLSGPDLPSLAALTLRLRELLRAEGFSPWDFAEAEVFSADGETLVVARRQKRLYIELDSLEELLPALALCGGAEAALYTREGGYLLALDSRDTGLWPREFGRRTHRPPDWERHAREQGRCLSPDAGRELLPFFHVKPGRPPSTE